MRPELVPLLVDDRAGAGGQTTASEKGAVVVTGQEARLLALAPVRDREPCALRLRPRGLLVLGAEREPDAIEPPGIELREHVRLILRLVERAVEQQPAPVLERARVMAGREAVAAGPGREREQLAEAEAAVAGDARIRRLTARVAVHERGDDRPPERFPQVERDVRQTEAVTGLPGGDHGVGGAAGPLGARPLRIEPEAQRHADRLGQCPQQRDGAVDAAAHRHGRAPRARRRPEDRPDRVRERVDCERLAAHRGGLEQGQACKPSVELGRVGFDDVVAVDQQPYSRPLAAARRVAEDLEHAGTVDEDRGPNDEAAPRGAASTSTLPMIPSYVNLANQVGAVPFFSRLAASVRMPAPFM